MTVDLILIGLACSLEPVPLTAFILTLATDRGKRNALFFLLGWIISLAIVILVTLAFTGGKPPAPSTAPANGVLAAKIAIGVGLVGFAWYYSRKPAKPAAEPAWMKRLDHMSPLVAVVVAMLVQPWGLVAAGCLSITQADTSNSSDVLQIVGFALLASISLIVMLAYTIAAPERARARLDSLRVWLQDHRQGVIVYLAVIVGLWLIGKSLYALFG